MPAISVIVPTRLRNHLLPRAVNSLLAQTCRDFEILVVDDNPPDTRVSRDPSLAALLDHPKVRVLSHETPRNAAAARNVALRAAGGEWITFLDDDDAYRPGKLEKQLQEAQETKLPIGACGVTYHLKRRRRTRVLSCAATEGSELLLLSLALPTLFHRNTSEVFFEETLSAGEDAHYFYRLLQHFRVERIFNVAESLVNVYPQPGPRVNANAEGLWQACQLIHRDFASAYGAEAATAFLLRSRLGYLKFKKGGVQEMTKLAWKLSRLRGRRDLRLIVNSFLFRIPLARRFLVS